MLLRIFRWAWRLRLQHRPSFTARGVNASAVTLTMPDSE